MSKLKCAYDAASNYEKPLVKLLNVRIEFGFAISYSQQEPSPWDDM